MELAELLRLLTVAAFSLLGAVAAGVWWRMRTGAAAWLAAAFAALAVVLLIGRLTSPDAESLFQDVLRVVSVGGLLAFPYLLFRFATAFRSRHTVWERVLHVLATAVLLSSLAAPWLPREGEPEPWWFGPYTLVVLGYWTLLSVTVAVWLFRAGRAQPAVARRRMRLMGVASLVFNVALLIAVAAPGDAATIVTHVLVLFSATLFILGFAPPRSLREYWRRPAQARLREAESQLMAAASREEVASTLLPHAGDLLGGAGSLLLGRDGAPLAAHGLPGDEITPLQTELLLRETDDGEDGQAVVAGDALMIPMRSGWLVVRSSPYAPFFGLDEIALVERLALLVDLAWGRIELFEAERSAREELERAITQLEEIVYGLSHDLRNPLVTILGYLDVVELDYGDAFDDQGRHFLTRIRSSATYMDALIRDLLELSRIGRSTDETAEVDLSALVGGLAAEVQHANPGTSVTVEPLPVVHMNPTRARQLFTNLLENAVHHAGREDVSVHVTADILPDGGATVAVTDNGKGIPPDYRDRIFRIFEHLDTEGRQGTGIGLAICRKVMERLNGSIEAVDPPGTTGARFRIVFPAAAVRRRPALETSP